MTLTIRVALLFPLLLAGCAHLGPPTVAVDRFDYSSAIADSWKQQTLLNIVKLRYMDLPVFVDVSSIVSGYSLQTGVNVNGTVSSESAVQGNFGSIGGQAIYTDRPTITYAPLTGEKFLASLITPIDPKNVFFLLQSGYAADFILGMAVESLNGVRNRSTAGGVVRDADPDFVRALELLREVQTAGAFGMRVEEDKVKGSTGIVFFQRDNVSPEIAEKSAEVRRLLKLPADQQRFVLIYSPAKGADNELAVNSRSMLQIMQAFASRVDVPEEHLKEHSAWPSVTNSAETSIPQQVPRIHSGKEKPAGAFAAVRYRDYWFWVDNGDLQTKRALTVVMFFFTLSDSGGNEQLPLITIPAQWEELKGERKTMKRLAQLVASICCCAVLLVGGCSDAPLDFPRTASFAFSSPQETKLGRAIEPQAKAHPGESGVYLLAGGGPDALVARTVLIDAAEKSIDFQYFMFEDDLVSNILLDHLFAAADRGVHVRMLLDDFWQAGRDRRLAGIGAHPNVELRVFNPVGGDRSAHFSRSLNYVFGPERIRGRMHNKALIVDAAAVVVGGRNIGDHYFAASEDFNYGDVDMVVVGHAVSEVSQTFDQYWNAPVALPIQAFVPAKKGPECLAEVNARLEKSRAEAKESVYTQKMRDSDLLAQVQAQAVPFVWGEDEALADAPGKSLMNSTDSPDAFIAVRLKAILSTAKHEVLMTSPYFVPGKDGMKWFNETCARGVTVKALTNSLASTDVFAVQGAYQGYRRAMLRAGVELFELRPDPERTGKTAELYHGNAARAALHAKILIIDRETLFVGSHNIDPRSGQLDSQNGILIHSPELATQLASVFDQAISPAFTYRVSLKSDDLIWTTENAGKSIEYHEDPKTGWWRRLKAALLSGLSPEKDL